MTQAMLIPGLASLLMLESFLFAQDISGDTTPHSVRFVAVGDDVKLEVLDWGGSGQQVILLHAGNSTAHDFDQFAPKLTGSYQVYGITRRGSGASSAPPPTDANYSADRLGDDVLAVIDDLGLDRPVLVGHSLGGQELSSVGSRHPDKVAGLIYLDAGYQYAYYDRSKGFLDIEVNEVRRKLEQLEPGKRPPDPRRLLDELLQTSLPELERTLRQIQEHFKNAPPQPQAPPQPRPPIPPIVAAMSRKSQR
jgi:pimeloyl-ACP methyl ester carboxylesterase